MPIDKGMDKEDVIHTYIQQNNWVKIQADLGNTEKPTSQEWFVIKEVYDKRKMADAKRIHLEWL